MLGDTVVNMIVFVLKNLIIKSHNPGKCLSNFNVYTDQLENPIEM